MLSLQSSKTPRDIKPYAVVVTFKNSYGYRETDFVCSGFETYLLFSGFFKSVMKHLSYADTNYLVRILFER